MAYIFKVGVIGAGTMGAEIAQVVSYAGIPVILKDVSEEVVKSGLGKARAIYQKRADKGKMPQQEVDNKMLLISGQTDYDGFDDVDLVIEAVPERLDLKKSMFAELDKICHPGCLFASNTSALSITAMGEATSRPDKMVGMHFFNPASVMKLVEVIPGQDTSQESVDDIVAFCETLRKLPIVVQECAGFVVNRLLMPYLNEALWVLQEGSVSAEDLDRIATEAGMPMGPLTLADMLGIDICVAVGKILVDAYGDRLQASPVLADMAAAGRLGMKSGRGFFTYGDDAPPTMDEILARNRVSVPPLPFSMDRLFLPMINEAIRAHEEGIAGIRDINVAMRAGAGMPTGPLEMADERGLDVILEGLQKYQAAYGDRFKPSALLEEKVKSGELGQKSGAGFLEYT